MILTKIFITTSYRRRPVSRKDTNCVADKTILYPLRGCIFASLDSGLRRNDAQFNVNWIPAFAGMTLNLMSCVCFHWIPACAGMTKSLKVPLRLLASKYTHGCLLIESPSLHVMILTKIFITTSYRRRPVSRKDTNCVADKTILYPLRGCIFASLDSGLAGMTLNLMSCVCFHWIPACAGMTIKTSWVCFR